MPEPILPDVLEPGLRVVFCGTAAGPRSARVTAYYAGPGNRFWDVLYQVGLTPYRLEPEQFREVLRWGIGLTNMATGVMGLDRDLTRDDFDPQAFRHKMDRYQPQNAAFVGKKAAAVFLERSTAAVSYGLQTDGIGGTALFVLPSTSGAARGYWDASWWWALAARLGSHTI